MNPLIGIWLVMRVVSFALMAFILVFMIGGHGVGATGRAIAFMEPGLLVESPVAFGICAVIWLAWAFASWRFLFSK